MFHMRKLSNTRSTPVVFSSKPTKTRWAHGQWTSIYPETDDCASRDTTPTPTPPTNHISTKPHHRRGRPSIDKSQVSKPFPILAQDERELFDVIASGSAQTRVRRVPKVAEKKVKVGDPKLVKSSPKPKPKVVDVPSQSWYTPAPAQPLATGALQRSVSNVTPRTSPSKVDVGRANSTKEVWSHLRTRSDTRWDGVEQTKRHVHKGLITHTDCPWVESNGDPHPHAGSLTQYQPVRSATMGSYESDETAVEGEAPIRVDAKVDGWAPAKDVQDTLRPTVRLVSKSLPDPPVFDSLPSRWSQSTGSVYSDSDPFRYDKILDMFPAPPNVPNADCFKEDFDSLSTPPVFMSCSNHSSSSVVTITPAATSDCPTVRPLKINAVQQPKVAAVVHQTPRASCSFTQAQDSLVLLRGRVHPQPLMKGSVHTSIPVTGAASDPRRISSPATRSHGRNRPEKSSTPSNNRALREPNPCQLSGEIKQDEKQSKEEQNNEYYFPTEFGLNPYYSGEKRLLRGPESDRPDKAKQRKRSILDAIELRNRIKVKQKKRRLLCEPESDRPDKANQRRWL